MEDERDDKELSLSEMAEHNRKRPAEDISVEESPKQLKQGKVSKEMLTSKIELYSLATPNGMKVSIALEEMGFEYKPHTIRIGEGEQFTPEFMAINPTSKIPAITDPNGPDGKPIHMFESGAILIYLAEKSGKFLSRDPRLRWETIQWVFFQMAEIGPMFGEYGRFFKLGFKKCNHPYPLNRSSAEVRRLLGVLNKKLTWPQKFLVGNEYSIADMATFPWVHCIHFAYDATEHIGLLDFPNVVTWTNRCMERPDTAKGLRVCPLSKLAHGIRRFEEWNV